MAVFTPRRRLARSSEIDGDELHAVANTEDRDLNFLVKIGLDTRRVLVGHARRAAGEDHSFRPFRGYLVSRKMKRMYLAIDALLTHTTSYKLCILRSKIEN